MPMLVARRAHDKANFFELGVVLQGGGPCVFGGQHGDWDVMR